jgi:hypothetical protein
LEIEDYEMKIGLIKKSDNVVATQCIAFIMNKTRTNRGTSKSHTEDEWRMFSSIYQEFL